MMNRIRNISKFFLAGLIPVILLMFLNASVNKHTHQLPNGEIIVHAHMFAGHDNDTSSTSHSHTDKELNLLNLFGNPFILIIVFFLGVMLSLLSKDHSFIINESILKDLNSIVKLHNKAPPIF